MFLIAEIGINHNGDLDLAKKMIGVAKICGANAVKFQKRTVEKVYTPDFLDSYRKSEWGLTQRDQKNGLEFGEFEYQEIDKYCDEIDLPWFASAWDLESFQFLESFGVQYHKIASPMLTNLSFLELVAKSKTKTFISTGMSTDEDISTAVDIFEKNNCPIALMHCVSKYPCPDHEINLNYILTLRFRYPHITIGYSGHETGIIPSLIAYSMDVKYIERHFTLDRSTKGSDHSASVEPHGLWLIAEYGRQIDSAMGTGRKNILPEEHENAVKMRYWL